MGFELNFENPTSTTQTNRHVVADMQAVARLSNNTVKDVPRQSLDQFISHDTFPSLNISDKGTERAPANESNHPLHQLMKHAISASHKLHASLGIDMAKHAGAPPKEGSGCPGAALRKVFAGGNKSKDA